MAVLVQSRHFDGKQPNWYHSKCFFPKCVTAALKSTDDIGGYAGLRWDDQKFVKDKLAGCSGTGGDMQLAVEYAKSNRSTCRAKGCGEFIPMVWIYPSFPMFLCVFLGFNAGRTILYFREMYGYQNWWRQIQRKRHFRGPWFRPGITLSVFSKTGRVEL